MDRRTTPANDRVAAETVRGQIEHRNFVPGRSAQIVVPVCDLRRAPDGERDRQLIFGDPVTVLDDHNGWSFVQSGKDGYVGYVPSTALGVFVPPTHSVSSAATHLYTAPDFKSAEVCALSFASRVTVIATSGRFGETAQGFIPLQHVAPSAETAADPVSVATLFLGTPYLWGGNSRSGIDCSGLVQVALMACGHSCPGDSDQQQEHLGTHLQQRNTLKRNDLLFWKGHVALAVDGDTILHANVHHMAVAYEGFAQACQRIEAQGDGPVLAHKRL